MVYDSCRARHGYLAGTDELRARDLTDAFLDDSLAGVLCIRGGYGAHRLLPLLDIAAIAAQFAGYGFDMVPFIAGLIVGPVAGIVVYALGMTGKLAPKVAALLGLVLVLVGVVIARYFFYAASIL